MSKLTPQQIQEAADALMENASEGVPADTLEAFASIVHTGTSYMSEEMGNAVATVSDQTINARGGPTQAVVQTYTLVSGEQFQVTIRRA